MSNQGKILYRAVGGIIVLGLFIAAVVVTFVTESHSNISATNQFMQFLVDQHIWIMASLVVLSTGFGFFWSHIVYQEVKSTNKTNKSIMDIVFEFLSEEEKKVINHLMQHEGVSTQSNISKLEGMHKVKAHRVVQKMQEKNLLKITIYGKVRKIKLREEIKNMID